MVCQTIHCSNKKISEALRDKLVKWIMKHTNMRESPIARDALLITDVELESPKTLTGMLHVAVS